MNTGAQKQRAAGLIESYARWRSSNLGQITDALEQQLLFDVLGSVAGKTLLDVGCGDGAFALKLAQRGAVVIGLDPDPAMIAAARQRARIENVQLRLIVGKSEALPFPNSEFDLVLAVAALCFVPDAERAIAEMARVLKPGGRLIIGELSSQSLWAAYRRVRGWFGHPLWRAARFRSQAELCQLVSGAGLDVLEMRGAAYYPPSGAAARLLAVVDPWLGRRTALGAAFIALSAAKPAGAVHTREREMKVPPILPHEHDDAPSASTPESLLPESRREKGLNFYEHWILPPLLDWVMRQPQLEKYRREVVGSARGRVLEIGVGSGLNLPFYSKQVEIVIGIDPSPRLLAMTRQRAAASEVEAKLIQATAAAIPLADGTIDTVVMTWTLCSIPDPLLALSEMRRVLKPDGRLLFIEHGLCPEVGIERWQHRLTPIWRRVSGGCHLDRKMDDLIRSVGFELTELRNEYADGPRIFTYMYEGCALRIT